jgi:hypothetical protein
VLGLGLARLALAILVARGPSSLPRMSEIGIDARVLAFALAASVVAGVLFGLFPALKYAGHQVTRSLGTSRTATASRERQRARNALVVAQVALALVLLVGAGLMVRTFQALRHIEPGFTGADSIQTVEISIPASLVPDPDRVARLQHDIVDALAAIPSVTAAGITSVMPMVP